MTVQFQNLFRPSDSDCEGWSIEHSEMLKNLNSSLEYLKTKKSLSQAYEFLKLFKCKKYEHDELNRLSDLVLALQLASSRK
ncbi:hypothetical protein N9137_02190 [Pseudomonadales bacterium]|nr:hypothetical protein [Pseudomonadales bacterium]